MPRKPKPAAPNTPPQPNGTEAPQGKDAQPAATDSQISIGAYLGPDLHDSIVAPDGTVPSVPTQGVPGWVSGTSAGDKPEGDKPKHAGGRPSLFRPEYVEEARRLCSILSATDLQVAQFFGVSLRTIDRWRVESEEFRQALKIGKEEADDRVERSLYQRATGYSFDSEKVFNFKGMITRAKVVEHVPPDVVACIFWLKNRRRELWRDKHEVEHTGAGLAELIAQSGLEVPGVQAPHKAN